jgi:hypothetical protein
MQGSTYAPRRLRSLVVEPFGAVDGSVRAAMLAEDAVQTGLGMNAVAGSFVHELEHADSVC